ncbi:MAG: glycosyltransferase family 2 protein, partial [Candidatus Hodarchaeota archaeon]
MFVSLIIPTYNRYKILKRLLLELNYQKGNFEVIVINDASTDRTNELFHDGTLDINYELKYIELENHLGLPSARNIGIKYSHYDIIGFLDDDCIPLKNNWLTSAIKWFRIKKRKIVAVGGPVYYRSLKPTPPKKNRAKNLIGQIKKYFPEIISNFNVEHKKPIIVNTLPGGNMFLRKSIISLCGGFNPLFSGNYYREETDICMKLSNYGILILDPKIPVNHLRLTSGGCRVDSEDWYTNVISNTVLLILKNWGNPIEILSGTSTYFLKLIYNCIREKEDKRYYNVSRNALIYSIFRGFWRGIKNFFYISSYKKLKKI